MKPIILALTILLIGCIPASNDNNNHGFGFEYDATTDLGIRYRSDSSGALASEDIDQALKNAATCLGFGVRRTYDLFVITAIDLDDGTGMEGFFAVPPPLIAVEDFRYERTELDMLEHEMVHFLLWLEAFDIDAIHGSRCYPHGTTLPIKLQTG